MTTAVPCTPAILMHMTVHNAYPETLILVTHTTAGMIRSSPGDYSRAEGARRVDAHGADGPHQPLQQQDGQGHSNGPQLAPPPAPIRQ